jgi:hypothetical protein
LLGLSGAQVAGAKMPILSSKHASNPRRYSERSLALMVVEN